MSAYRIRKVLLEHHSGPPGIYFIPERLVPFLWFFTRWVSVNSSDEHTTYQSARDAVYRDDHVRREFRSLGPDIYISTERP